MLTSNKPYTLKSLAKVTNTTIEQLNHAMLSFIDKKLVIVKEFPSKKKDNDGREGKKLYWATTVMLRDDTTSDDGDNNNKKKEKKGSDGAIQKELVKLLATPREINDTKMLYTKLEQQYKDIQKELQPLLAIPTMSQLDDDITSEERKLKMVQDEIDKIRTRIREQSEGIQQQQSKPVTYGGYYRMQQQQRLVAQSNQKGPPDPNKLKRKINAMLSEYKTRKRKCMDFVNDLADAMEKHPREIMSNEKILGLDTDEMEWGWWKDCSSGKIFGTKPKMMKKKKGLLGGGGGAAAAGRYRGGGGKVEEEEEKECDEPSVKIPAKYTDV